MPAVLDLTLTPSVETPVRNAEETLAETRAARLPPALRPYCFQPGNKGGGRPKGRLSAWNMIGQLVVEHPEYKSSIRALLQASNVSTQLVTEALLRRVEDKDWRPQLRAVELIARITGELKESTIIQQQAVSVEDSTKLQALAAALIAARQAKPLISVAAPVAAMQHDTTVPVSVADSHPAAPVSSSVPDSVAVQLAGLSVEPATENQLPTPPIQG